MARRRIAGWTFALVLVSSCSASGESDQPPANAGRAVRILSAEGFKPSAGEASPEGRMLIGRGKDYVPIPGDPEALFRSLEGSMALRRQTAWKVVEAMLEPQRLPVKGQTYDVPLWHTWFEGMEGNPEVAQKIGLFVPKVAACMADSTCTKSRAEIAREVMDDNDTKNLVRSLVPGNFSQVLRQFSLPGANPAETLGLGFTLYSPSFLEHVLTEAEGIDHCPVDIAWNAPPPSATQFSPCMKEFPRSAAMVKTQWTKLAKDDPRASYRDTDGAAVAGVIANGTWTRPPKTAPAPPSSMYTVADTNGDLHGLTAIHFSTKDTREWLWVSLWWSPSPNTDFGQDRPASIGRFNDGVWANYKMCVTSAFEERDNAPWSSFAASSPDLARALKAVHEAIGREAGPAPYDRVTTWCSNPYLETHVGNGRTNCIGCHQYPNTTNDMLRPAQPVTFSDTYNSRYAAIYPQFGRSRRRLNFPAEFAWGFPDLFVPEIQRSKPEGFDW